MTAAVLIAANAVFAQDNYNGNIQYFIADLGPTSPCHPLYERSYTWVDTADNDTMDRVLNSLVKAGFNGIRLPMWPNDDRVNGPDPANEARNISRAFCDSLNKNWVSRIKTAVTGTEYKGFAIHFSPAFDNRAYQSNLTKDDYASWVLSYTGNSYSPDFVSPFSGNYSTLELEKIPDWSQFGDF